MGTGGVEVLTPFNTETDPRQFLLDHGPWVVDQLDRVDGLAAARRTRHLSTGEVLLRGRPTRVEVKLSSALRRNRVGWADDLITITLASRGKRNSALTLERAMRTMARSELQEQVAYFSRRLGVLPGRLYVMEQRTKWGNCSRRGNLSFNWRLIMAQPNVLTYLVAHETLHLAIPDHSQKFWLTLQSICPEMERARQWLAANSDSLLIDLTEVVSGSSGGSSSGLHKGYGGLVKQS